MSKKTKRRWNKDSRAQRKKREVFEKGRNILMEGPASEKPKAQAKRLKKRNQTLQRFSKGLKKRRNISDLWFEHLWEESGMIIKEGPYRDRFNEPFPPYIPDCVNFAYRYVIECDDPSHEKPEAKLKDQKKDEFFKDQGYTVIRVKSHNYEEFKKAKEIVKQIRLTKVGNNPCYA